MALSDKQAEDLIQSINELSTQIYNLDLRLQALIKKLGTVAGAIRSSSESRKQ